MLIRPAITTSPAPVKGTSNPVRSSVNLIGDFASDGSSREDGTAYSS